MAKSETTQPELSSIETQEFGTQEPDIYQLKAEYITLQTQYDHLVKQRDDAEAARQEQPDGRIDRLYENLNEMSFRVRNAQIAYLEAKAQKLSTKLQQTNERPNETPLIFIKKDGESVEQIEAITMAMQYRRDLSTTIIALLQDQEINPLILRHKPEAERVIEKKMASMTVEEILIQVEEQLAFYNEYLDTKAELVKTLNKIQFLYQMSELEQEQMIHEFAAQEATSLQEKRASLLTVGKPTTTLH